MLAFFLPQEFFFSNLFIIYMLYGCGVRFTYLDKINMNLIVLIFVLSSNIHNIQVTATDGDKDRPQNIVYFLTGQGIDPDNPANSKFDINRTTGEIFVLKVR